MNAHLTKAEFESLPVHDDLHVGQLVVGQRYRRRGDEANLYIHAGNRYHLDWDCRRVDLIDDPWIETIVDGRAHYVRQNGGS